jgi:hypothetical protein
MPQTHAGDVEGSANERQASAVREIIVGRLGAGVVGGVKIALVDGVVELHSRALGRELGILLARGWRSGLERRSTEMLRVPDGWYSSWIGCTRFG